MKFRFRTGSLALAAATATTLALVVLVARAAPPTLPPVFTAPLTFTNEFFPFQPGAVKTYRGKEDGERIVVVDAYDTATRTFAWGGGNVECHQLRELEFEDGELVEISYNFFAQADDGTVFYFGEVVDDYDDGVVVDHEGSWLVGGPTLPTDPPTTAVATDPAVFMPANPEVGDQFKPEDLPPIVDETVTVLALDDSVKVEGGKFKNTMRVKETSSLDSGSEKKWYAHGVGVVKVDAKGEKLELIASTLQPTP